MPLDLLIRKNKSLTNAPIHHKNKFGKFKEDAENRFKKLEKDINSVFKEKEEEKVEDIAKTANITKTSFSDFQIDEDLGSSILRTINSLTDTSQSPPICPPVSKPLQKE